MKIGISNNKYIIFLIYDSDNLKYEGNSSIWSFERNKPSS